MRELTDIEKGVQAYEMQEIKNLMARFMGKSEMVAASVGIFGDQALIYENCVPI